MNTNDFSKCKVGEKLWSLQLSECVVVEIDEDDDSVRCENTEGARRYYSFDGKYFHEDNFQSLFFSKPEIIAPAKKEPLRLECECVWLKSPEQIIYPDVEYYKLCEFVNKRTRMILEEII